MSLAHRPKVTVALPVRNEEKYIAETIESVLSQTFGDFELLVADNDSSDDSFAIAEEYSRRDPRVRVVRHPANAGAPANFRYCLNFSDSQYFTWLGAHDRLLPGYLGAAMTVLDGDGTVVLAYPRSREIGLDGEVLREEPSPVHTVGLSAADRVKLIANGLESYTCYYGLYRRSVLQRVPVFDFLDADRLLLASIASFGHIHRMDSIGIERRVIRVETDEERLARYASIGIDVGRNLMPYRCGRELVRFTLFEAPMPLTVRMPLAAELLLTFPARYRGSWRWVVLHEFPVVRAVWTRLRSAVRPSRSSDA